MDGSSQRYTDLLPQTAHSVTICGQTGCGKTVFILDLLEGPDWGFFRHIVVLCPVSNHSAQQDLSAAPLDLDGP